MEAAKELPLQIIELISSAFAGVSREGGISLHQTRIVDDQGSEEEMLRVRGSV